MKKAIKIYWPVLVLLLLLLGAAVIYKINHSVTIDRIFSKAEIDIPDDFSDRDDILNAIGEELADGMPYCRITRLYLDGSESEPPIKRYADKGIEATLVKMDFYIPEGVNMTSYSTGTPQTGYSWLFIRDNTDNSWKLESSGYIL